MNKDGWEWRLIWWIINDGVEKLGLIFMRCVNCDVLIIFVIVILVNINFFYF